MMACVSATTGLLSYAITLQGLRPGMPQRTNAKRSCMTGRRNPVVPATQLGTILVVQHRSAAAPKPYACASQALIGWEKWDMVATSASPVQLIEAILYFWISLCCYGTMLQSMQTMLLCRLYGGVYRKLGSSRFGSFEILPMVQF